MKNERLFQVIGMIEDDFIKEAEEEKQLLEKPEKARKKQFFNQSTIWKWGAAAGILLVIGLSSKALLIEKNFMSMSTNKNEAITTGGAAQQNENTCETNALASTFAEIEEENIKEQGKSGGTDRGIDGITSQDKAANGLEGSKETIEDLYLEIIYEIYQPYEGYALCLNLEGVSNLTEEEKLWIQNSLISEYEIEIDRKENLEETSYSSLSENVWEEGKETLSEKKEVYLLIKVLEKQENEFTFAVSFQNGEGVVENWENCHAKYGEDKWDYDLDR